jgi:hypothetical protein
LKKFVKLHIVTEFPDKIQQEYLWAEIHHKNTARILNIPATLWLGKGDVVRFDPTTKRIIQVLCKGSITYSAELPMPSSDKESVSRKIRLTRYFSQFGIDIEFLTDILIVLSVPLNMNCEKINEYIAASPVQLYHFSERRKS